MILNLKLTTLLFGLCAFSMLAEAAPKSNPCSELGQLQTKIDVVAGTLANAKTTRTPEGGPYVVDKLICKNGKCQVASDKTQKIVYEPGHVDADGDGYVAYPNVDIDAEVAMMAKLQKSYDLAKDLCLKN